MTHPEYQKLIYPNLPEIIQDNIKWQNSTYSQNTAYYTQLNHETIDGHFVRSKSESIIYNMLHQYNIPFRYECLLSLGDIIYYPDFTIRHPTTGEPYY